MQLDRWEALALNLVFMDSELVGESLLLVDFMNFMSVNIFLICRIT